MSSKVNAPYGVAHELVCVINGRNLGDAVIQSRSVRRLIDEGFARRVLVWTRPQSVAAYEGLEHVDVITSAFPVGTYRTRFGLAELRGFLRAAGEVRRRRPEVSLDFLGDVRERLFALAIRSPRHISIAWAKGHPFRRNMRSMPGHLRSAIRIPAEVVSVYEAHSLFVDSLTGVRTRTVPAVRKSATGAAAFRVIGLHPFASQEWKLWPDERWLDLCQRLLAEGKEICVFGAAADLDRINSIFGPVLNRINVVTDSFRAFLGRVPHLDLMIGLDSLGVHAADRAGVRSVMIASANLKELWAPPWAVAVGQSGGCPDYPCYNRPSCRARADRYVCVRSIQVEQVLEAMNVHAQNL